MTEPKLLRFYNDPTGLRYRVVEYHSDGEMEYRSAVFADLQTADDLASRWASGTNDPVRVWDLGEDVENSKPVPDLSEPMPSGRVE